jgi:hypothetical protein
MKTFEEIFRQEESLYRQYRKELKHDTVINKLALVVRSADQTIEHYQNHVAELNGVKSRLHREKREYKVAMYRFMYMTAVSVLANVILITLLMR